ncbi:MAG TPA: hypothetical protein VN712_06485 [Dermatophilaceae bacterium]|nr:hypothetical protein [Dermatophilaceae bacterium]
MWRQLGLTDRLGRVGKRAPVEVPVAQHAAAGVLEHKVVGVLPGRGRGDLLGQEPGEPRSRTITDLCATSHPCASKIERFQPALVGFNGREAAEAFIGQRRIYLGQQAWSVVGRPVFVLPSSSAANRSSPYDGRATRLEWWSEFRELVRAV